MRMEGDHSLACMLLSEYQYIIDFLKKQMQAPNDCNFAPMMRKMISKAKGYLDEALKCDAVILATMFNPAFQLLIFKIWFPTYHDYAQSLLQEQYNELKSECTIREVPKVASLPSQSRPDSIKRCQSIVHNVDFFPKAVDTPIADELEIYLGGKYKVPYTKSDIILEWWQVSQSILFCFVFSACSTLNLCFFTMIQEHHKEFPILASMAQDYLACSATSATVEQCFSAAADICGRDQGSLGVCTIERLVSSHQWLIQGFKPNGKFKAAHKFINCKIKDKEQSKPKKATTSGTGSTGEVSQIKN